MPSHNHSATITSKSITGYFPADTRDMHVSKYGGVFSQTNLGKQANGNDGNSFTKRYDMNATHNHTATIANSGSNSIHNNIQPYITIYIWRRTS